jgi:hypothetical protein
MYGAQQMGPLATKSMSPKVFVVILTPPGQIGWGHD